MERHCRFCQHPLEESFVDLGLSPIANDYLSERQLNQSEKLYPLHAYVCSKCLLVQLEEFESPQHIFGDGDYAYFSSYSDSFLKHAKAYTDLMVQRFGFNENSQIVEIASNDGYLLQYFHEKGIPVLGVEPASNVAQVAESKGVPSWVKFFGIETAHELVKAGKAADLLLGNNVLAHVPDLNDFVGGMKIALKPDGVLTMEFPHLLKLIQDNLFDTIYHEHFSYLSFITVEQIFAHHELTLFDVEEIPTHGGSLRIYGCHSNTQKFQVSDRVTTVRSKEIEAGLQQIETYTQFETQVKIVKLRLLECLIDLKFQNKNIIAYGAAAKGNTLLNYCGIRNDFIDYIVDRNPHKQNLYLPGTRIPIYSPDVIQETKPDYILILAWNLKDEIMSQLSYVREWGCKFITPLPTIQILD